MRAVPFMCLVMVHLYFLLFFFFFFFQAEDGIRDDLVTGVQTCALPIFVSYARHSAGAALGPGRSPVQTTLTCAKSPAATCASEIGRASCREKCRSRGGPDHEKKKEREKGGRR